MNGMRNWLIGVLFGLALLPAVVAAHEQVTRDDLEQYAEDGTLAERRARIRRLQPERMSESIEKRAIYKVRRAELESTGLSPADAARALTSGPSMAFPFSANPELRSTGKVRTLTILVDFKDQRAAEVLPKLTVENIQRNIYGAGNSAHAPYDSVHEYYRRASQDQVDIQGSVLAWHHFAKPRKDYEPAIASDTLPPQERDRQQAFNDNQANFRILKEALQAVDQQHDFTQYDNDGDKDLDLVTILYAGPRTGWGSFWWAYRWEFFVPEAEKFTFDGIRARQFVFQFVETRDSGKDYNPLTLLHETGHAFGLADYYDYDKEIGPGGGVGGLDMMDANMGNQNAFSRWLLDWIKPVVLGSDAPAVRKLAASGAPGAATGQVKAIAIFPGLAGLAAPRQEMFIVENRYPVGNDRLLPGKGLLIWHVDATVKANGNGFANDNSYTDTKLIRLVRAGKKDDFTSTDKADATTYFAAGHAYGPDSTPSSEGYGGRVTQITIDQIGPAGEVVPIRIGFVAPLVDATPALLAAGPGEAAPTSPPSPEAMLKGAAALDLDALEELDRRFAQEDATRLAARWQELVATDESTGVEGAEARAVSSKLLLAHWASKDGASATAALEALPDEHLLVAALPTVLESWAQSAPADAARWYLNDTSELARQSRLRGGGSLFTEDAFEGLYAVAPVEAVESLEQLTTTADVVSAVDGIIAAAEWSGEGSEPARLELKESGLELVRARVEVVEAIQAATERIKDPANRREFEMLLKSQF